MCLDVVSKLVTQRTTRDGEGDLDGDVSLFELDGTNHAEVNDIVAELGIDNTAQCLQDGCLA